MPGWRRTAAAYRWIRAQRPTRAGGVAASVAMVVLVTLPVPAEAVICSCADDDVTRNASKADAVFSATVTSVRLDTEGSGADTRQVRIYTAKVDRVYQGVVSPRVQITTSAERRQCGVGQVPEDTPWMLFVNGKDTKFFGNTCGGTGRLTAEYRAKVEESLGEGNSLEAEPTAPPEPLVVTKVEEAEPRTLGRLVAPGAALTVVGLLGLVLVRRRPH
jgi:hypothetical protein